MQSLSRCQNRVDEGCLAPRHQLNISFPYTYFLEVIVIYCRRGGTRTRDLDRLATVLFYQLNYTAPIYIFEESIMPAAGRHISSCRDIDTATIDSSVSSINIHPLRWLIRLSFSPTLPSALHYYLSSMVDLSRRSRRIRNLPRFFRLYLRVGYRLFHSVSF